LSQRGNDPQRRGIVRQIFRSPSVLSAQRPSLLSSAASTHTEFCRASGDLPGPYCSDLIEHGGLPLKTAAATPLRFEITVEGPA